MPHIWSRRSFVELGGALLFAGLESLRPAFGASGEGLYAKVTLDGREHVFSAGAGRSLGDYVGPNFVQRNIVVRDRTIPFTVFFRPDAQSDRIEVVFEWGDVFNRTPSNLGPYTAEIFNDGKSIATIDVPEHIWLSRWRWQTSPRPFVKSADDLFKARVLPPIKKLIPRQSLPRPAPDYSVMGFSNIEVYMGTTGERGDIGVLPEYYAAYLATGDDTMKKSMMAWAESAASFPWHIRDSKTDAPVSWNTYPNATTSYDGGGSPLLSIFARPLAKWKGTQIQIEQAHEPGLAFIPFMLTGDLYFLEEMQFMATHFLPVNRSSRGLFDQIQTRGWTWSLRTMLDVVYSTPEKVTGSLLPKSYWKAALERNRNDILTKHVRVTDTKNAVFASGTDRRQIPFWQEDYLATTLGVAVYRGFEEWRPVFEWKIRSDISRTNGTSGWPRTTPTLYFPLPGPASISNGRNVGNGKLTLRGFDFTTPTGKWTIRFLDANTYAVTQPSGEADGTGKLHNYYSSAKLGSTVMQFAIEAGSVPFAANDSFTITVAMAKTWGELAAANGIVETPDGNLSTKLTFDYPQTVRTALVMGVLNGVAAAAPCLEWFEPQMLPLYTPSWRWSFATSV